MTVTLDIPDEIERVLRARWSDLSHRTLEALAIQAYRQEILSHSEIGELLSLDFWRTEAFLARHGALSHYDADDLNADRAALATVLDGRVG